MIKGLESNIYGERLKELRLLGLVKRRLMDDLITFFRYLISYSSDQLFSIYNEDRTKGNSLKFQYEGLGLDLRKIPQRMRLFNIGMDSLKVFKSDLEDHLPGVGSCGA